MSVTDSENNTNWESSGTNQWLANNGSWAAAVSGDQTSSNIPNNKSNNQNDENGSQNDNQNLLIASNHFDFENINPNELYSTKWGKSVINHEKSWEIKDLSPSSANEKSNNGFKPFDPISNNIGTELWENNLRQTKELNTNSDLHNTQNIQKPIEQLDTQQQWKAMSTTHIGGTWGEEEDLSNFWTGLPNSTTNNSTNPATNTSNVFNRHTQNSINSINCDKSNLQLFSNNNSNKNWISETATNTVNKTGWSNDENENWGESKTGTEWESAPDILDNKNKIVAATKNEVVENWNCFNKPPINTNTGWNANEISKTLTDTNVDDGTSLWGNFQGQNNKVLLWKSEENKRNNNSQAINSEQWKYQLNGQFNNGNKNNWNELFSSDNQTLPNTPNPNNNVISWNDNPAIDDKRKLTKEIIQSSSPYRILIEMGFKSEEVENSLRNCNLNLQESIEELRLNALKETGIEIERRKQQSPTQCLPLVNNILRNNVATNKLPNSTTNLPSEKLLSHLVQQVQLAVQSGHLNAQVLNQQLAPTTITLVYQLLQQIKMMQNLQNVSNKNSANSFFQNSIQINQCKQKIATLQKHINVQQALFFKQQQLQTGNRTNNSNNATSNSVSANPMLNNNLTNLTNDLNNLQLNQQQNQSRLNQWKLPNNFDPKDELNNYSENQLNQNEFSRAPGPSNAAKQNVAQQFIVPNSWAGINEEATNWQNNLQRLNDTNQLSSSAPQTQFNNYGDIVNDYNSNKQMQLNNAQVFAPDQIYNWPNKLTNVDNNLANASNTFNSSTWTFSSTTNSNPQVANAQNTNIWNNSVNAAALNKAKGPPPGLAQIKNSQPQKVWTNDDQNSTFLFVRNLSPQIDESMLKTLFKQHGQLLLCQMFLNHGIAFVKYSSKEEASKAQLALNNCSLGNSNIQVNLANENEVQQYLSNFQQQNSIYNITNTANDLNNYMMASNNSAQWQVPNSSNNWSFNQTPNLWNAIDQNTGNLLPDNLLEST